ncbi:MAG: 3-ketoacyl-ACP reductase [Lentisphaeraceae bacterium]|nr:3-ketoacyl-ACP reductase [Lentisphaeraceae bacterium]
MTAPVILVTGASRGLGRGMALELARGGYSVAINYAGNTVAAAESQALCEQLAISTDQKFITVKADVSNAQERKEMLDTIIEKFGRLDGLVNNAGIAPRVRADISEASEESFEEIIKVNLQGPYFLTQEVSNYIMNSDQTPLLDGGKGRIIFVTSISSHTASVLRGDYCISKAGLSMAVQLWAQRLASEDIQVYELRPGIMKTDMTSGVTSKYDALIEDGLVPQKRWGTGEDLGRAALSLIKGDFSFSPGTVIDIDGGFQIRHL